MRSECVGVSLYLSSQIPTLAVPAGLSARAQQAGTKRRTGCLRVIRTRAEPPVQGGAERRASLPAWGPLIVTIFLAGLQAESACGPIDQPVRPGVLRVLRRLRIGRNGYLRPIAEDSPHALPRFSDGSTLFGCLSDCGWLGHAP